MQAPTIEEIVTLDLLTLREHTELAGDELNVEKHRASVARSLNGSEFCAVRRNGSVVAYAMLQPESSTGWFVTGFNTHPLHRTASVLRELFFAFGGLVQRLAINELRSNVYKTNRLSLSFHRKLGFRATRENGKAVEFFASVAELASNPSLHWTRLRRGDELTR